MAAAQHAIHSRPWRAVQQAVLPSREACSTVVLPEKQTAAEGPVPETPSAVKNTGTTLLYVQQDHTRSSPCPWVQDHNWSSPCPWPGLAWSTPGLAWPGPAGGVRAPAPFGRLRLPAGSRCRPCTPRGSPTGPAAQAECSSASRARCLPARRSTARSIWHVACSTARGMSCRVQFCQQGTMLACAAQHGTWHTWHTARCVTSRDGTTRHDPRLRSVASHTTCSTAQYAQAHPGGTVACGERHGGYCAILPRAGHAVHEITLSTDRWRFKMLEGEADAIWTVVGSRWRESNDHPALQRPSPETADATPTPQPLPALITSASIHPSLPRLV